jgi:hypothetical protein
MADITERGSLAKDDNNVPVGWKKNAIVLAAPTTTIVKATPGVLHSITFNKPVATGVVTVYDAATATGTPVAIITTPASPMPVTLLYDIRMDTGITITSATAAQDITVSYI